MYISFIKVVITCLISLIFIAPVFINIEYEHYDDSRDIQIIEPYYIIPGPRIPMIE